MMEFCVLLCTCKKYEFLVKPFLKLFNKYWPNNPSTIYINSDGIYNCDLPSNNIVVIDNSKCVSWSERLINSLNNIQEKYVLLVLDDFLFKGPVNQDEFYEIFNFQKTNNIKCIQFYPQNKLNKEMGLSNFYLRKRWAPYRISAQIWMYEKSYLLKILRKKENPWEFELCGSFRSSLLYGGKIICAKRNGNYVFDTDIGFLIVRGTYTEEIRKRFEVAENVHLPDLEKTTLSIKKSPCIIRKIKLCVKCILSIFRN